MSEPPLYGNCSNCSQQITAKRIVTLLINERVESGAWITTKYDFDDVSCLTKWILGRNRQGLPVPGSRSSDLKDNGR